MTQLKKINLPNQVLTESLILKSLNASDVLSEHFSITDLQTDKIGTYGDLPAATVVFDLSGSSLTIRQMGAKEFAAEHQYIFKVLTDIIYDNYGIIEKFPGDGISMHFPIKEFGKENAIRNACRAIKAMEEFLTSLRIGKDKYRFTLTYGEDTIITTFGSSRHLELISIGNAVNVAHKLEKYVKNMYCYLGIDYHCVDIAKSEGYTNLFSYYVPSDLQRSSFPIELWYGVKY